MLSTASQFAHQRNLRTPIDPQHLTNCSPPMPVRPRCSISSNAFNALSASAFFSTRYCLCNISDAWSRNLISDVCFAGSRGFMATKGNPHYDRAARVILKDYVKVRSFCAPVRTSS